jgi:hypothetical protein
MPIKYFKERRTKMHILINVQPMTKEEMIHWDAFSFVSTGSSPRLYNLLTNLGLLNPRHIKAPVKHAKLFWDIVKQFHYTGKDIKEKLDPLFPLTEKRIITL